MAESYRTNKAWQKSMEVVTEIYRVTSSFPEREIYGLARQMREASTPPRRVAS